MNFSTSHLSRTGSHRFLSASSFARQRGKKALHLGLNFWVLAAAALFCVVVASWVLSGFLIDTFSAKAVAAVNEPSLSYKQPNLELHIANNGLVYMQGGRVVSLSRTTLVVSSEWEASAFRWRIETDENTRFVLADGEKGSLSDVRVGDYVNISGHLMTGTFEQVISAESVRLVYPREQKVVQLKDTE